MCSYITEMTSLTGSAKAADEWVRLSGAAVYFDHPQHALADHTLNIDLTGVDGRRIAVELTAASARRLLAACEAALAEGARNHIVA
jgi:hypothetical protein